MFGCNNTNFRFVEEIRKLCNYWIKLQLTEKLTFKNINKKKNNNNNIFSTNF